MTITIYGIANCDTMRKARAWLEEHGVRHAFHDYRSAGLEPARLDAWMQQLGWEALLNNASASFRALPQESRQGLTAEKARALMLANPTMIKRPLLDLGDRLLAGFRPEVYERAFGRA